MISAQPTQKNLQDLWDNEPWTFHTTPMAGFEEQGLSAAQWALLAHPTNAFWKDKSRPQDRNLWAWAIDNARQGVETLEMMVSLGVPVASDTLVRLLLRSAATGEKIPFAATRMASMHPLAWTTEKDKTTAPEVLTSPNNITHLRLLDYAPELLGWKKESTGNGLLHCAVLYKAKTVVAALLGKGASQEPNHEGATPKDMAVQGMVAWPTTFGQSKTAMRCASGRSPAPVRAANSASSPHQMSFF